MKYWKIKKLLNLISYAAVMVGERRCEAEVRWSEVEVEGGDIGSEFCKY